MPVIIKSAMN